MVGAIYGTWQLLRQRMTNCHSVSRRVIIMPTLSSLISLSGVPDLFDRNKILSGGDLSHYQVPHSIRVFFYFVWFVFIHHNFILNYVPIVTFWILTYHKIWILLIIFCFIWNYWIIYFFNMFGSVLECCELTGVSLLWPWLIKWK